MVLGVRASTDKYMAVGRGGGDVIIQPIADSAPKFTYPFYSTSYYGNIGGDQEGRWVNRWRDGFHVPLQPQTHAHLCLRNHPAPSTPCSMGLTPQGWPTQLVVMKLDLHLFCFTSWNLLRHFVSRIKSDTNQLIEVCVNTILFEIILWASVF